MFGISLVDWGDPTQPDTRNSLCAFVEFIVPYASGIQNGVKDQK